MLEKNEWFLKVIENNKSASFNWFILYIWKNYHHLILKEQDALNEDNYNNNVKKVFLSLSFSNDNTMLFLKKKKIEGRDRIIKINLEENNHFCNLYFKNMILEIRRIESFFQLKYQKEIIDINLYINCSEIRIDIYQNNEVVVDNMIKNDKEIQSEWFAYNLNCSLNEKIKTLTIKL